MCITMCIERHDMRTNIVLDDDLVEEAFKYSGDIKTKKDLVEIALREYVAKHKMKNLQDLRGKIQFDKDYNYKDRRIDS
jgi:Arc/MetJ family transcription regulator